MILEVMLCPMHKDVNARRRLRVQRQPAAPGEHMAKNSWRVRQGAAAGQGEAPPPNAVGGPDEAV